MNKVILMGRLTRDPNVRYTQQNSSQESMCVARYTLAVDRRGARDGQQSADFISCVAFGKNGEFAEKYLKQGTKIAATGRIQTGSYTNRDGQKVYTTDVVIEEQEFAESKRVAGEQAENVFVKMPSDKQLNKVREWLLYAVTKAEKELGGGTGQIKLRYVYDMFVARFTWLARVISFEAFSIMVDEALERMKKMLESNKAMQTLVSGEAGETVEKDM